MDDDFAQLEAELRRLRPAAPSQGLAARIGHELIIGPASASDGRLHWLWSGGLPAAVALAALLLQFGHGSRDSVSAPTSDAPLKPVAAENLLVSVRDEGLVTLDDGTRARRERLHYVDTIVWKNSRTHASLTWSVPREEVRIVPVVFQ